MVASQYLIIIGLGGQKTYLKKAGLLDSPKRATFVITDLGLETLMKKPGKIDAKYLKQFPSFIEFINPTKPDGEAEE